MDAGAVGWMLNQANKNYWRVSRYCDLDDLIQDGYACYWLIRKRYPDAVDPAHIMSLFKITYVRHIHALSNATTNIGIIEREAALDQPETVDNGMARLISEAPTAVASFLRNALENPKRLGALYRRRLDGTRETVNDRFRSIAGIDGDLDLRQEVLDYLKHSPRAI